MKGHNKYGGVCANHLRMIIGRIEKLEEEKANLAMDIREVYAEAKGNGFDAKAIKQIVKIRKLNQNERIEQEAILDTYMGALGMLPLFEEGE